MAMPAATVTEDSEFKRAFRGESKADREGYVDSGGWRPALQMPAGCPPSAARRRSWPRTAWPHRRPRGASWAGRLQPAGHIGGQIDVDGGRLVDTIVNTGAHSDDVAHVAAAVGRRNCGVGIVHREAQPRSEERRVGK